MPEPDKTDINEDEYDDFFISRISEKVVFSKKFKENLRCEWYLDKKAFLPLMLFTFVPKT